MKKMIALLILGAAVFSCSQKNVAEGTPDIQKTKEVLVDKEKSFSELFTELNSPLLIGLVDENDHSLGRGYYKIYKDGSTKSGYGVDYMRLALIKSIFTDDSITFYFSYLLPDGKQVENPPFYRVVVTKDEVKQVIKDVKSGKEKYYSIDKVREFLGNELPKELEGVKMPW